MNNQGELVGFQHKTKVGSPYHLWEERFVTGLLLHLGDDANRWGMVNAKKTGFIQEKFFTDFMKTHDDVYRNNMMSAFGKLYKT